MYRSLTFVAVIALLLTLGSCRSAKPLQRELNTLRSQMYYELTSPVYTGEVKDTVYMDFIDYSNMNYVTSIHRKGGYFIPLILFNLQRDNFSLLLGERSLNYLYREFLTEALLTECNSSTCFQLADNSDAMVNPDSVYRLEIKVRKNETVGGISILNILMLGLYWEYVESRSTIYHPSITDLLISVRLTHAGDCLLDKTYEIKYKQPVMGRNDFYETDALQASMDNMAESLSLSTKKIVETICQELNLVMTHEAQAGE
ncbi:MAG: hypothetical protein LBN06_00390 [Prevotellaceae bacterium]|jgi:hypothetical protein|nr:hypothetical protein [Prevotellaceae bacterium]